MKTFDIPSTPSCRVVYVKDGTTYAGVLNPSPKSNSELQARMLERKVGMSRVQRLEPIQPPKDFHRNDPAGHQVTKYLALSDRS